MRRDFIARKLARILLATLVGVALGAVMACDQAGPAEQAQEEMGEMVPEMDETEDEQNQ